MSKVIHTKKSQLPPEWQEGISADPDEILEVRILTKQEAENDMPPEENFRPEFIEEMKQDDEDYKAGKYTEYESNKEMFKDMFSK